MASERRATGAVARIIRDSCQRYGLSYRDLERASGISKGSIGDYASGNVKGMPKSERVFALARALRVPRASLIHAFLVDLGMDIFEAPATAEDAVQQDDGFADEEKDLLLRQMEIFRRNQG